MLNINSETTKYVKETEIKEYEENGAICLRGLFSPEWVERMRTAVEREISPNSQEQKQGFQLGHSLAKYDNDVRAFIYESPGAQIAREIMRSKTIRYYFDQIFVKEPGVQAPTPWHQDQPYWPVKGKQICSIWLALDDVTKASSGLEYIKGSHNWDITYSPAPFSKNSEALYQKLEGEKIPDFDSKRDEFTFLNWDMAPGDCLIHQGMAIHGASGNTTRTQRRRAISVRWLGDDTRYFASDKTVDKNLIDPSLANDAPMESLKFPQIFM